MRANPGLLSVEEMRSQVQGGIREARADAFPQLTLSSSWGQSRSPSFLNSSDFDEILDQFPGGSFEPSTQELSRAVVELKQPVWTFGKIRAAIDLAKIVGEAADAQIRTAQLDAAFATAEAYYRVQAAREGLATIESEREYRSRDLARIEDLLEIGEATQLEQLRAFSALAAVDPEVARRQRPGDDRRDAPATAPRPAGRRAARARTVVGDAARSRRRSTCSSRRRQAGPRSRICCTRRTPTRSSSRSPAPTACRASTSTATGDARCAW